nr:uncharacterized protein LOC111425249 [Onthophagus taurus]
MLDQVRHKRLVSSNNIQRSLPEISIELSSNSKLLTTPYTSATIYFEVTNNQEQAVSVAFTCTDSKNLLQNINPGSAYINPNQTITVTVQLSGEIPSGNYDVITFSSTRFNAKKVAYLYVNEGEMDSTQPEVWYSLITDCSNVEASNCQSKSWEVNIFARDKETGVLQFTSQPRGIYFNNNNFISGSKEEIAGHYTANCCNSKLTVTAVDLRGNKNTLEINSYEESAPLSAGFASAIALGVILLVVIIIIIIYFIIKQKRKGSLDLPTYRGPSGSRTPL